MGNTPPALRQDRHNQVFQVLILFNEYARMKREANHLLRRKD
jgi:hypothetical protein